jgi:hypothetical protein
MAIRGLARAKVDSSTATAGMRLALNGSTLAASFTTYTTPAASVDGLSEDIGMLLEDVGGDGVMRVWLKWVNSHEGQANHLPLKELKR